MRRELTTLSELARLGFAQLGSVRSRLAELGDLVGADEELLPLFGAAADPDQALDELLRLARRHPVEHGKVALLHQPLLEGPAEARRRFRVARQEQAAAGIAVQPVHGHGPALKAEAQRFEMIFQAQRAVARAIDGQPCGLVDHQGFAVDLVGLGTTPAT